MEETSSIRTALVFFIIFIAITLNLEDNMVARMGFDPTYLMMTLVAVIFTGLLEKRSAMLVILVLFLSVGANMPAEVMLNFGIDRDHLTWTLFFVIIAPFWAKLLNL